MKEEGHLCIKEIKGDQGLILVAHRKQYHYEWKWNCYKQHTVSCWRGNFESMSLQGP